MMMLGAAAGATLSRSATITLSAPFDDITDPALGGATTGNLVALSWSGGGSKVVTVTHDLATATLRVSDNGGAYNSVATGGTVTVDATTQTLQFSIQSAGSDDSSVVTLTADGVKFASFVVTALA